MPLRRRHLLLLALAVTAGAAAFGAEGTGDGLPPEPRQGEWIADTLENDALWFAATPNLEFEAVAGELTEYPRSRRWVRVVNGQPAWVMYYVPGEILGFEVDTHHFGALGTEFEFAVGSDWKELTTVEADWEEITGFEAKWMRLYRVADGLPRGTKFLQIRFPTNANAEAARLTEVWLRCRFDEDQEDARATVHLPAFKTAPTDTSSPVAPPAAEVSPEQVEEAIVIEPYVVTAITLAPPARHLPPPIFTSADLDRQPLPIDPPAASEVRTLDLPELAAAPAGEAERADRPRGLLGWIARVIREGF